MPLLIGPDAESEQWVVAVARDAEAPYLTLQKVRRGDVDVEVVVPDVTSWRDHTPVLVDDIISTGHTMIETIGHLRKAGLPPPVCIGVHGIFAADALDALISSGAARVVTVNTIPHSTNEIDIMPTLAEAFNSLVSG
jgi:ribose-phosphate pyrophosphokinase